MHIGNAALERRDNIPELLQFLEIDDDTMGRGRELWELIGPHADSIIDSFYARVRTFNISPAVTDASVQRLKIRQKEHWAALFDSRFGADYIDSVCRVGVKHRDIDLNPLWYVAGYISLKIAFTDVIAKAPLPPITKGRFMKALDKYVAFDMALALSAYNVVVVD